MTHAADPLTTWSPPRVWPTLRARDASALIDFLVDAFGFEVVERMGDGDRVHHAELAWPPGGGIMLGTAPPEPETADRWPQQPGSQAVYIVADDPDTIFGRAVSRGATALREPNDTDYGSRECAVRDPEGNLWSFGTYGGASRRL